MQELLWDVEVFFQTMMIKVIEKKINFFLLQTCNEVHLDGVGGGARRCRGVTRVMDGMLRWNIGKKKHTCFF